MIGNYLNTLEASGLIQVAQVEPDLEYLFRHALVQDAAYESLLREDRRRLHLAVGEALESIYAERLDEFAAVLGYHFDEAHDDERALKYLQMAADNAARQYAQLEAIDLYSHALEVAARLDKPAARLYKARGAVYELTGGFDAAHADYDSALSDAQTQQDRTGEWQALLDLGFLWLGRDYSQAGDYFQKAMELARELNDPMLIGKSLNRVGNWHLNSDHPSEALNHHREALAIFQGLDDKQGLADTFDLLGMSSALNANLIDSAAYYDRAIPLFQELGNFQGLVSSLTMRSLTNVSPHTDMMAPGAHRLDEAITYGKQAIEICQRMGFRAGEAFALGMKGITLVSQGNFQAGFEAVQQMLAIATEINHRQWQTLANALLGEFYLELINYGEAQKHLEQALDLAHQINSWHWIRTTSGLLATVYASQGKYAKAENVLKEVLDKESPEHSMGRLNAWRGCIELTLARGDADMAWECVQRVANLTANGDVASIPRLSLLGGRALAAIGKNAEAEDLLKLGCTLVERFGAKSLLWRMHQELGKLYDGEQAEREFAAAHAIIDELAANISDSALKAKYKRAAAATFPKQKGKKSHD